MIHLKEDIPCVWNLAIDLIEEDGRVLEHHRSHNIVTNAGRQFMAEVITPATLAGAGFTRTNNEIVRYIGFGIGGSRQSSSLASSAPLSVDYPGTNVQTDIDVTVNALERPVRVTAAPLWMREISTPGTFPLATSTRFIATFGQTDISYGSYTQVPLSEIGLFKSDADPSLPNGTLGAYPGAGGQVIAYDTFAPITKTGLFSIQVRWEFRF